MKASFLADGDTIDATVSAHSVTGEIPGTTDSNDDNNSTTTITVVNTRADIKTVSATRVTSSGPVSTPNPANTIYANDVVNQNTVTYTFEFSNDGPSDAQNVKVTDTLPRPLRGSGARYRSCVGPSCSYGAWTSFTPSSQATISLGNISAGSPFFVQIEAHADSALGHGVGALFGPFSNVVNSANAQSNSTVSIPATIDPTPGNNTGTAAAIVVWTVPSTPPGTLASPGNTNAFFKWDPPTSLGGGSLQDFRVKAFQGATGTRTLTVPPDTCGTSNNAFFCVLVGSPLDGGGAALTNLVTYGLTVEARNEVGFSDPSTQKPVTPTIDASAKQIGIGNLSQHTGNTTLPTSTDKQISFQDFPSNTTGVGTSAWRRTSGSASVLRRPVPSARSCRTKLHDPSSSRHLSRSRSLYDKTLI